MKKCMIVFMFAVSSGLWAAGGHDKELAEIKEGQRIEAKASWWGFNKEDSTQFLQAAIDSGVKKLVVDNTGDDWVIEPVSLADDQEIVFEKGVVVIAKKNSFKKTTDSLFTARCKKNIILRGEGGVVLKMRKTDYHDVKFYAKGEWRNAISLLSSENIKIQNLTLLSSGGDGIYIGRVNGEKMNYCKNVLIDNVVCDDNNRQGISVISAENLIVRNSVFKNTRGAPPEAGIDFEPNEQGERLVNCLVENCRFEENNGKGIDMFLKTD
ncbi:MAG: right-handed parallel beta-helix repeat-containing protein, partial [Candidatus Moranbacteria bacterium]|nr:right-handed parallel beta-helix repeat-containing protein [Candidatus Moranbacteria bacterium]